MEFLRRVVDGEGSDTEKVIKYSILDHQVVPVFRKYIKEDDWQPPKTVLVKFTLHLSSELPATFRPGIRAIRCTSGLWNMTETIMADDRSETVDDDVWFHASVYIPQKSEFEWRWTMYNFEDDDQIEVVDVERDLRRCQVGKFGGILHTSWDNEVKIFEPDMCVVTFYTSYQTLPDESVALVGSSDILGEWKSTDAISAYEYPLGSSEWTATVPLEKNVSQEWKWIITDKYSNQIRRWEDRLNREIKEDNCDWKHIWAPWGGGDYVIDYGFWKKMDLAALRIPRYFDTSDYKL